MVLALWGFRWLTGSRGRGERGAGGFGEGRLWDSESLDGFWEFGFACCTDVILPKTQSVGAFRI